MSLIAFVLTHELQIQHQSCSPVGHVYRNFDRSHLNGAVGLVGQRKRSTNRRHFEPSSFAYSFEHVGTACASCGQTGRLNALEGERVGVSVCGQIGQPTPPGLDQRRSG
jgi:hypothetical protein